MIRNLGGEFNHPGEYPRIRTPWGLKEIFIILFAVYLLEIAVGLFGMPYLEKMFFPPWLSDPKISSFFFGALIQTLAFLGLIFWYVLKKHRLPLVSLGFKACSWSHFWLGLLGGVALFSLITLLMVFMAHIFHLAPEPQPFASALTGVSNWQELIIPLIVSGFLAPLGEEVYFRGFVYPYLRSWGLPAALLISSAFFAALHFDLVRFLPLALSGIGLALLCEKTGSLFPSIFAHSTWNIIMTLLVFFMGNVL